MEIEVRHVVGCQVGFNCLFWEPENSWEAFAIGGRLCKPVEAEVRGAGGAGSAALLSAASEPASERGAVCVRAHQPRRACHPLCGTVPKPMLPPHPPPRPLQSRLLPCGLHVVGCPPTAEEAVATLVNIAELDRPGEPAVPRRAALLCHAALCCADAAVPRRQPGHHAS